MSNHHPEKITLNGSILENSKSPNAGDGSRVSSGTAIPPIPFLLTSSSSSVDEHGFQTKFWKSAADFQEKSRPSASLQEKSRPSTGFQEKSRPSASFQEKSRSSTSFQKKSRSAGWQSDDDDFQEELSEIERSLLANPRSADLQSDDDDFQEELSKTYSSPSAESHSDEDDNQRDGFQEKLTSFWDSSQKSSAANSPWIDANEFLFQVGTRLYNEQINAFLANLKELYDRKQTVEETSKKAGQIFGTYNRDLFLSFQGLLVSSQHPPPERINTETDGMEFFIQVRSCLSDEQLHAFVAAMEELNAGLAAEEETLRKAEEIFGTDNRDLFLSFQGLLVSSQKSSAANSPLSDYYTAFVGHYDRVELSPLLLSPNSSQHSDREELMRRRQQAIIDEARKLERLRKQKKTFKKLMEIFGTDQFQSFKELLNPKIH